MKRSFFFIAALFFLVATGTTFAQSAAGGSKGGGQFQAQSYILTVLTNVRGATIYVNGSPISGNAVKLPGAQSYSVTVKASGYGDFNATVTLNGDTTVEAPLSPTAKSLNRLSVQANVPGAQVFINGIAAGTVPFQSNIQPGYFSVAVKAPGYVDYSVTVNLSTAQFLNVVLTPLLNQLSILANVPGAQVYINGVNAGTAPFQGNYPSSNYSIVIRAPGYYDYAVTVPLYSSQSVTALLQPMVATVEVRPPLRASEAGKGASGQQNLSAPKLFVPAGAEQSSKDTAGLEFYVDGVRQASLTAQVPAGSRVLTLIVDDIRLESTALLEGGRSYVFQPGLTVTATK